MRGVYTFSKYISVSVAKTLLLLTSASGKAFEVLDVEITNGDTETNQQLRACLQTVNAIGSAAGTTLNGIKHESGDQVAATTALVDLTTEPTSYNADTEIGHAGFTSLGGFRFDPIPEKRPTYRNGEVVGLRLLEAPSAATGLVVSITIREIG